ncbi:16380_t:CDS:2, partial [Racocetra fulgida]
ESSYFNSKDDDVELDNIEEEDNQIMLLELKKGMSVFDNQSKNAILSEYRNEISTRGLSSIIDEYFLELNRVLQKQMPNIVQLHDPRQQFGFGIGYAKKALDYTIHIDKMNKLVNQLDKFINKMKEELLSTQEIIITLLVTQYGYSIKDDNLKDINQKVK